MDTKRFDKIRAIIDGIPAIDVHTHLGTGGKWQAQDLTDILLYHWLGTELSNAGLTKEIWTLESGGRANPSLDPREVVRAAVGYCQAIRNTSNYWAFKGILRDLYGIEGGLTETNWEAAFDAVAEHAQDSSWQQKIFSIAKIERAAVEFNSKPQDRMIYFNYAYAEPLYGAGLGDPKALERMIGQRVETGADLDAALTQTIKRLAVKEDVHALHVWLPASWRYTRIQDFEIDRLMSYWVNGETISGYEQNCLASFSADILAREAANYRLVIQLFHGSAAYGRGMQVGTWHPDFLRTLIYHIGAHPKSDYDLFLATRNASHEATSMARMHANLMVSGGWWHGFTPTTLREFFRDRLEMLPMTRWNAFYSDAYCAEWCYGKLLIARNRLATALTEMVEEGLIGNEDVAPIAKAVLYDNPKRKYLDHGSDTPLGF